MTTHAVDDADRYAFVLKDMIYGKAHFMLNGMPSNVFRSFQTWLSTLPNGDLLLLNISRLFICILMKGSDNYVREGEKKWKHLLSPKDYDQLVRDEYIVGGFILLGNNKKTKSKCGTWKIRDIELIDTRIRGLNIGRRMIEKYEEHYESVMLRPKGIIFSAREYWKRYYAYLNRYYICECPPIDCGCPREGEDDVKISCMCDVKECLKLEDIPEDY